MHDSLTIVVDIGKTHSKLSLWDRTGRIVDRWIRANVTQTAGEYRALDVGGIDRWLIESLRECASRGRISRIVPVGHGAAAAIIRQDRLWVQPMDYEASIPADERRAYAGARDPFPETGSPLLPDALNLGMQLHRIESLFGTLPEDATILPWPQYWAWRLSGVMASEVTSLGCHSDLWRPMAADFSSLARERGWARRIAPMTKAGAVLGSITADIARATGLPPDCGVLCGMHDSNAALVGSRGHEEIANGEATVLSTGTWFVAMRTPAADISFDATYLSETRDCLINVDIAGRPVPSARFMGGREFEQIVRLDSAAAQAIPSPERLADRVAAVIGRNACAVPTFVPGVGPFPGASGRLVDSAHDANDRNIVASLYLAMMSDTLLGLIGSDGQLLIEGRFADDGVFVHALASIRPKMPVYTCSAQDDLAYGALRLVDPTLSPPSTLNRIRPLDIALDDYVRYWHQQAGDATGDARTFREGPDMRASR